MTVKEHYEHLQTIFGTANESSCHFLTLCSIAEEATGIWIDVVKAMFLLQSKGLMDSEFYIKDDGCKVLSLLTNGKKWTRKDVEKLPPIRDNDYTEAIYFNPRTQFKHFRRRYFDTLKDSVTVKEGYIIQYRIYTIEG